MLTRLREKLSYANVVATLALFVALGGSAYAIGAGAIGSREIRDNSVRSRDVRSNSLTGRDINERSLRTAPKVYVRNSQTTVTLSSSGSRHSTSCADGDTAVGGGAVVDGDQLNVRVVGNPTRAQVGPPTAFLGIAYGEPSAVGQRRNLNVTAVCLARARR